MVRMNLQKILQFGYFWPSNNLPVVDLGYEIYQPTGLTEVNSSPLETVEMLTVMKKGSRQLLLLPKYPILFCAHWRLTLEGPYTTSDQ